jgi:hypothetical protein
MRLCVQDVNDLGLSGFRWRGASIRYSQARVWFQIGMLGDAPSDSGRPLAPNFLKSRQVTSVPNPPLACRPGLHEQI